MRYCQFEDLFSFSNRLSSFVVVAVVVVVGENRVQLCKAFAIVDWLSVNEVT